MSRPTRTHAIPKQALTNHLNSLWLLLFSSLSLSLSLSLPPSISSHPFDPIPSPPPSSSSFPFVSLSWTSVPLIVFFSLSTAPLWTAWPGYSAHTRCCISPGANPSLRLIGPNSVQTSRLPAVLSPLLTPLPPLLQSPRPLSICLRRRFFSISNRFDHLADPSHTFPLFPVLTTIFFET